MYSNHPPLHRQQQSIHYKKKEKNICVCVYLSFMLLMSGRPTFTIFSYLFIFVQITMELPITERYFAWMGQSDWFVQCVLHSTMEMGLQKVAAVFNGNDDEWRHPNDEMRIV